MPAIKQLLHINAPQQKVYDAISTINGLQNWWTVQTAGKDVVGETISFRFGEMGPDFKVIELIPGQKVTWQCIGGISDWQGTTLNFELDQNDGKTRIRFEHKDWKQDGDFYASCAFTWGRYLESLRQYCQTGKGESFGSQGYRK
jgi:uncharacterized protein YndB with AHSA1/START domain